MFLSLQSLIFLFYFIVRTDNYPVIYVGNPSLKRWLIVKHFVLLVNYQTKNNKEILFSWCNWLQFDFGWRAEPNILDKNSNTLKEKQNGPEKLVFTFHLLLSDQSLLNVQTPNDYFKSLHCSIRYSNNCIPSISYTVVSSGRIVQCKDNFLLYFFRKMAA